jgi:hypothetical protein
MKESYEVRPSQSPRPRERSQIAARRDRASGRRCRRSLAGDPAAGPAPEALESAFDETVSRPTESWLGHGFARRQ